MSLWKAIGMWRRSNIVEGHTTGNVSGVGKPKKTTLTKANFIKLLKANKGMTYNEFTDLINEKYRTLDGRKFTKNI